MSSIIEGYNYDIFISYRQKDNKGDRWVSEFVEALKTELESTFKEEISVYFDINPHDGLLETHDVDASLKDKLMCLVFIPIISRTYCDQKSFAWEHEFKAFADLSSRDQFGLKVKLPNGNVANRILPVRIHELDNDDIKLCESILGGVLRGIELIYKESGFNRPLKPDDDEKININKTKYRNQITKVALAIKEILEGLKKEPVIPHIENTLQSASSEDVKKRERRKEHDKPSSLANRILTGSIILIVLTGIMLIYPKIFNRDSPENIIDADGRISVAVMPFQNLTNNTTMNIWQNGIKDELINFLSGNPKELKVRQTESINKLIQSQNISDYGSITPAVASTISKKLDAKVFITGSIKQAGNITRINVQLFNSKTKEIFKSFQSDATSEEEILVNCDSISKMINSFLIISILNKEVTPDIQHHASTNSPDALRYYILAQDEFTRGDYTTARKWLFKAIDKDPNFFEAIIGLTYAYSNPGMFDEAKSWYLKLEEKRDNLTDEQKIWTDNLYEKYFGTPSGQIKCYRQLLRYDDQQPQLYYMMGSNYGILRQYDNAISELEKSLEIYKKWDTKPPFVWPYSELGYAYHKIGQFRKERKIYRKAEKVFPDEFVIISLQATLSLTEGDVREANSYIEKYLSLCKESSWSDSDISTSLAKIYSEAGMFEKAEQYYRQALSSLELESDNSWYFNNLALFLIDNDRNIEEGMALVNKVLKLCPDDYDLLDTKGWGLFKQGKKKEALEFLEKSWHLRMKYTRYNHPAYLHLEAAKKAVAEQKNN